MDIDKLYERVETSKRLKTKIDKMNLGCVCDVKTVGENEITFVLSFNECCDKSRTVVKGFGA